MNEQELTFKIPQNIERYLNTLSKIFEKEGKKLLQAIVVNSKIRIQEGFNHHRSSDGSYYGHALYLNMPERIYLEAFNQKEQLQSQIREGLNNIKVIQDEFIEEVFFKTEVADDHDWRKESNLLITNKKAVLPSAVERIWGNDCFRVFISHTKEVKIKAAELKDKLRPYGISCFVAHEDIPATIEWQDELEAALHTMDSFVALLTNEFHDSPWTDQEVGSALARGVQIIPVNLGKPPYGFMGKLQALSCKWETVPIEIFKILIKNDSMINAYIKSIQNCENYDHGNKLSELLPFIDKLSDDQIEKLISAFNNNSQVSDSYGFNGKKPGNYGYGLLHYLNQITGKVYSLSNNGKIMRD